MAVALSRTRSEHFQLQRNFKEQLHHHEERELVPVVYYLTSNGQLQHPHFVEVPISSPQGLFLRDVVHRLHLLRGQSMASHYSWSSKRCYKNGYVWHDLEENDLIHPVHGGEYILKGSEIIEPTSFSPPSLSKTPETSSFSSIKSSITAQSSTRNRRRNQSWGAINLNEYKVYKTAESTHEFATAAADASTQTDDKRRRTKAVINKTTEIQEEESTELSRGDISPPQSDSSPETLESLIKTSSSSSSSSLAVDRTTAGNFSSGRMKASSVLMSLISCGSISVKDHGLSLITHRKPRPPRDGIKDDNEGMTMEIMERNVSSSFAKMALEDKEYFSGSLIENNKKDDDHQLISLKRSASCNAERSSQLKLGEKEAEGAIPKRVPRKLKA
ncbi:protein SOSEKI 5-like [Silene latifolia]|uniref:protein SOSEKI 5-like n=1 Tax=Silene latifolia TaxID=37657 RepID=UPI003D76BB99